MATLKLHWRPDPANARNLVANADRADVRVVPTSLPAAATLGEWSWWVEGEFSATAIVRAHGFDCATAEEAQLRAEAALPVVQAAIRALRATTADLKVAA